MWLPAVEAASLQQDLRIRGLLHTAASLTISAGAPVTTVQTDFPSTLDLPCTNGGYLDEVASRTLEWYDHADIGEIVVADGRAETLLEEERRGVGLPLGPDPARRMLREYYWSHFGVAVFAMARPARATSAKQALMWALHEKGHGVDSQ